MDSKAPQGSSSGHPELRIVLIDKDDDKNKVVKSILNCENLTGERVGLCTLYKSEHAGRKISVVEAPGWHRDSIPDSMKEELIRSVSFCPPGPHVLLLVIPVKALCEEPSAGEMKSAELHIELLSERVWKHTVVLFDCDDGLEESALREHMRSAEKILDKCGGRYYVLQKSCSQIQELLKKIDELLEENKGDFFIPQHYYELIQQRNDEREVRRRRGSLHKIPPNLSQEQGKSKEKTETVDAAKNTLLEDVPKISMDYRQFAVILMVVVCALLGSVAGAQNGVLGSFTGIVFGIVVGVLLASVTMYIHTNFYLHVNSKQSTRTTS
ncbi:GTPase IMAP family member 7 [Danio aesculapii]|uniref:GTPase IMAP family member 7 n=1 Tax=Danio aesculapii TaxID=1142201 RepID=UPI0024BF6418|nr:GTPase IMAP family member 7 [Danio aesculapii]